MLGRTIRYGALPHFPLALVSSFSLPSNRRSTARVTPFQRTSDPRTRVGVRLIGIPRAQPIISPTEWTTYSQYHGWSTADWRSAATFNWTYHLYQSSQCVPHTQTGFIQTVRMRSVLCPYGYSYWVPRPDGKHVCWKQSVADDHDSCTVPTKGNPVRITDRVKIQTEVDYQSG